MKKVLSLLFCNLIVKLSYAQDPVFSQASNPGNILNPSFNGVDSSMQIKLGQRIQWPNISGTYATSILSYNSYISKANGYLGFRCMYDNAGSALKSKYTYIFYAQIIKVNKNFTIKPAVEFGITQRKLDWAHLNFGDQIDSRNGFVYPTSQETISKTTFLDINVGALFKYKKISFGINAHHLTRPNESFFSGSTSRLPMRYGAQLGYDLFIGTGIIQPYIFYHRQNSFQQLMLGSQFRFWKHLNCLIAWRTGDAVIAGLGFINKRFNLMYSYDLTISKLTNQTGGAHELTFGVRFIKFKSHQRFTQTNSVFAN